MLPLTTHCWMNTTALMTTTAAAARRRLRNLFEAGTMAPGGTEMELGFWAGVSSLLGGRRCPPAGVGLRDPRWPVALGELGRAPAASAPASAAPERALTAGAVDARAASMGAARPVCVMVRGWGGASTGSALGVDFVRIERPAELGAALLASVWGADGRAASLFATRLATGIGGGTG